MEFKKSKNIFTKGAILLTMLTLIVSSFLFLPQKTQAQFVVNDPLQSVWNALKWAWDKGGAVAYRNSLNFFLQQAAKQSGEWLATGDAGKKPAFLTDPHFYTKVGDQMLGEFVDSVAGNFLGQSLCDTLDPTVKFNILANLDPEYQKMKWAEEPKCSFRQIKKNLEKVRIDQLFEFSTEVKEGKVAKQKSSISTVIQGDSVLTADMKITLDGKLDICPGGGNVLECIAGAINWGLGNVFYFYEEGYEGVGAYLHKYTNEFEDILKLLEESDAVIEVSPGEETPELDSEAPVNTEAMNAFKELKAKLDPEEAILSVAIWGDGTGEGLNKLGLKYLDKTGSECLAGGIADICVQTVGCQGLCKMEDPVPCEGAECFNRIERNDKYVKQLIEWATTLQDMIVQVVDNWETQQGLPDLDALEDAGNMFNPESNPMGIQMELESKLFKKQTDAIEKSKFFRGIQGSMNAVTSKVSGIVKLPSTFVSEKARESVKSGSAGPLTTTGVAFADAIGVFANTFMSQYMKVLFTKGLNPGADSDRATVTDDENETPNPDTTSIISELKVIPINQTSNEMSIYDEFAVCPSGVDQKYTSQFNCLLDNKLARAVEERMTIEEAIENGLLNAGERLGVNGDTRSLLSKSHIQKLRLIGVLPLGMQIASQAIIDNQYTNGMTLASVIEGFDQRGADGVCGNLDPGESEFCNLVDPNWVLKAPSYLCEVTGYSAIPLRDSSFRQESCLDLKTCINESEGNQCDTWSYCTREKNVWRFGGDECDAQYNTCTSYTQKNTKEIFSYLSNTLDFNDCSSSNVGCQWYCSAWDQEYSGIGGGWSCLTPGWRQYNCNLGDLCSDPSGCNCVCNGTNGCPGGLGSCLVVDGGISCSMNRPDLRNVAFFSSHIDGCSEADEGCSQYIRTRSGAGVNFLPNGSFELPPKANGTPFGWQIGGSTTLIQQITPTSGAQHNSNVVQIKTAVASTGTLEQTINNVPLQGNFILSGYYKKNSALLGTYDLSLKVCYDEGCADNEIEFKNIILDNNNWKYVSVSLSSKKEKSINHIIVSAFGFSNFAGDIYIDSLQLRNETGDSIYREYGVKGLTYLKSAPGWMNCYDALDDNNDNNCENFIQKCESKDVGCELYSPLNDNISDVPALINDSDLCPSTCVGYETFEEVPTNFINSNRWVDLIPQTAQKCSAPGCEEFTNMDALTQGGETREYYTYIRQCVKTDTQGLATVDSSGNTISPASADTCQYYYTWVGEETNGYQLRKYYLQANPSLGGPVQINSTPNPDWGLCDEDHLDNPYCRQFYDAQGDIYYRFYKNTITCSKDCSPYRRKIDDEIYMSIKAQGEVCKVQDVDCREYKGAAYGNMKNLFLDKFISNIDPWQNVEISNESINRLGQSIKADNNVAQRPVDDLIRFRGKVYSLSLWVKGSGNYIASFGNDLYFIPESPHSVSVVSNDWQEINFGSVYFSRDPKNNEKLIIQGPTHFYLDNITLNEVQDNVYLIKDSWKTPTICDIDLDGNSFPGYTLGCQAYWDRSRNAHYLKSFSRLCPEKAVGCEAMIDTKNSMSAFSEEFNSGSPQGDEIIIPADSLAYRVYDPDKSCASEKKGCQKFGLPDLDDNQEAIDFTDVYLLNDPDLYKVQSTLCDIDGEKCQEYEGQVYFKEPRGNICEYRENVSIGGENKNGWFKNGTDNPCYIENGFAYQPYGSVYGIRSNTDPLYQGLVGVCPENQNGCTRFINPTEQNLVLNNGFELDENGNNIPDNWEAYAGPTQFSLESTDCLSGNCWRVNHIVGATSAGTQYIRIQPGSTYELSVWMKTSNTSTGTSKIYLAYVDASNLGTWLGIANSQQTGSTNGKWIKHTVILKAPYNAVYARILAPYVDGFMDVRIDNISLIEQNSPQGSYYYLNDKNIDKSSCNTMVGLKEGCVLFNDTSIPGNLFYDSASTYALSQEQNDVSVPISSVSLSSGGQGDSNVVLKVRRDRVCGEWLQCSGYRSVWDSSTDEYRSVCDSWVRCDQLIGSGKQAQCGHIVSDPNPSILTEAKYKERDISWSGMDYSGYSMLDMYPVEKLFPSEDDDNPGLYALTYFDENNVDMGVDGAGTRIEKTTHIYPEKDSPFQASASTYYNKVNLCDSGANDGGEVDYTDDNTGSLYPDCQGSYQKVEYGDQYSGLTKYYNFDKEGVDSRKACKYSGKSCTSNASNPLPKGTCTTTGDECVQPSKITKVIGLRGFCLEPDESRPDDANACITWWPGASAGDVDIYNMHLSAGYSPKAGRNWYCASTDSNPITFAWFSSDYNCKRGTESQSIKYFYLSDNCPGGFPNLDEYCIGNKGGDPINSNTFKLGEIASIAVYLGADHLPDTCHDQGDEGWELLSADVGWWNSREVGSDNPHGPGGWPPSPGDDKTISAVKACFNEDCTDTTDVDSYLHHFLWLSDSLNDDGSATFGDYGSNHAVLISLKDSCPYLVNTAPSVVGNNYGLSVAYTDSLWSGSSYYNDHYGGQDCIPYGVANTSDATRLTITGGLGENNCDGGTIEGGKANIVYNQNGLQQLFVKIDEAKYFSPDTMSYLPIITGVWSSWNITEVAASSANAPKITSILGTGKALTIGVYEAGAIGPETSPYVANLKFYAWADTNHMPIREISIDWDDLLTPAPSFYNVISKNHRPKCDGTEFGSTPEACVDKYFSFNHTYTCEGAGSAGWQEYECLGMCCFKPKVYIKDNWGWCSAELDGVYAGWDDGGNPNKCKDTTGAGIQYNGIIKVNINN